MLVVIMYVNQDQDLQVSIEQMANCNCRGPSGTCPCRSKVDANGIRKHC